VSQVYSGNYRKDEDIEAHNRSSAPLLAYGLMLLQSDGEVDQTVPGAPRIFMAT
jgi:hypothetical protein